MTVHKESIEFVGPVEIPEYMTLLYLKKKLKGISKFFLLVNSFLKYFIL